MDFVWWIVDKFWEILGGWGDGMGKQRTKDADEPAPTNPAALVCLTMTTKPTFRAEFKPGEGGNKWGGTPST